MPDDRVDQVLVRLKNVEQNVNTLANIVATLERQLKTMVSKSDMINSEEATRLLTTANAEEIRKINTKLATIVLPEDTRFYLETSEVEAFKANFNRLQAMLAEVQALYKNVVAFTVNSNS